MYKAYAYTEHGGPEVETFLDLPVPEPGPGQLLVAVRAAGVNPVDWKLRAGKRRPGQGPLTGPEVLGSEVAGVVERVGAGVTGFAPGDAVFGNPVAGAGGYAEYTLLPTGAAAHKPDAVPFTDAAALPVAAATAYDGLRQLALPAGSTLLITGVGGGVGVAAAQLARHFGLGVVGTASAAKKEFVESLGAVHVARGPRSAERVREAATGGRVDAVFDLVGGDTLAEVADLLADRRGRLITAAAKETVAELGGAPVARARNAAVLAEVARLAETGVLRPHVTATYPLHRADEALRAVEDGHARGKTVIEVTG
ncbi:NADP-dependent oxidoreductase [Streptomyces sp. NRRL S-1521]|uniref:NADP-dependent oxidoreductase n=1 Tax=Streptomyces sp. NRRL S-1521 TaxID=1609100 RepID=UPI00074B1822|nr:NADP-dependent oxidoreductase [Streptomyces sp. NRRL S-1521]KUL48055.1 NADPH:quinone reductase [Streptomyces sp. NRRL S-1521]